MKVKELVERAKKELQSEEEEAVVKMIKTRRREIKSAEKTLKALRKSYDGLLESDMEDLELDDLEY